MCSCNDEKAISIVWYRIVGCTFREYSEVVGLAEEKPHSNDSTELWSQNVRLVPLNPKQTDSQLTPGSAIW
jgi:hypothetical protein